MTGLEIRYLPTGALTAYDRNPRTHPEEQIGQIAASIAEFGFASPIVTDRHHTIIAGHGRWLAAQRLGMAEVPVVVLDYLTDTQRRALTIADNWAFEGGGYDERLRGKDGRIVDWSHAGRVTQDDRIPDSVIRLMRHKGGIGEGIDHPAVFPVALPEYLMRAYTDARDLCYELFCGSGTSLLAAERTGRRCYTVEIAPGYVDVV